MEKARRGWILLFILAFMVIPEGLGAKPKHGAGTVIMKRDGPTVRGELVAVRKDSVLLKESRSSYDVSIPLSAIRTIKVDQRSGAVSGAFLGTLVGGLTGMAIGRKAGESRHSLVNFETAGTVIGAAIGVLIGGGAGLWIGSSIKEYETFDLEHTAPEGIPLMMGRLRSRARFPDQI